ncbi:MAG TPA: penicillin-binding protein 1C, partial [Hyphomicrobiaceae bacterium]|nr:penicillin-binding protein 1C [Hyphomicrobiaceae bacterium]
HLLTDAQDALPAVGFDGRYTIAVWVGRPDATATPGLTGRTAAAPLLFDAFAALGPRRVPLATAPGGAIIASGAQLPMPLRRFKEAGDEARAGAYLDPGVQIAFPPDRSVLEMEPGEDLRLALKAEGGALPLTWLIDGEPIAEPAQSHEIEWLAAGRGFARITVIDARGRTDRVTVRIK